MKKMDFVSLVLAVIGGLLFSIGMCMCLVEEWNAFQPGVGVTAAGAVLLAVLGVVRWRMAGKPALKINMKVLGKIALAAAGALVLGTGMCMIMVWNMMLWGIVVGIVGILLLLCLIPVCMGLK